MKKSKKVFFFLWGVSRFSQIQQLFSIEKKKLLYFIYYFCRPDMKDLL